MIDFVSLTLLAVAVGALSGLTMGPLAGLE